MRHRVAHRKLGRVTEHRLSLLRNQATALLRHERIETTVPKARELRPFVERLITIAKRGLKDVAASGLKDGDAKRRVLHARRLVGQDVQDVEIVGKLFDSIAPRFEARPGGYTRVLKLGARRGDNAAVAQIELIGSEYNPNLEKATDENGEPKAPAKSAGGVRGRLRAAASRLRGGKTDKGDSPESGPDKNTPAPRRRVTTPRKAG